eukprot:CAMPEP_0173433370 /NCGR_PEP_ID=MMETSP1357-20121228/10844_1 /TAXON_ID=77926 /ORGANISM="Hemiselmis rufescens, Strain PCC563" /LENGTH=55 /DNA_ID=CAMNT_0014398067 /DNA_START=99 /DNA_END=266 /DNA_ORIENTATION=-
MIQVESFLRVASWHPLPAGGAELDALLDASWEKRQHTADVAMRASQARRSQGAQL